MKKIDDYIFLLTSISVLIMSFGILGLIVSYVIQMLKTPGICGA